MEKIKFDIVVIGAGPGGYPAAIRAAQLGKNVALIEAKEFGGTCLNRGCIPSKALIANADIWRGIKEASSFGIQTPGATFDYSKMAARKDDIVNDIRKGLEGLLAANPLKIFRGYGQFVSRKEIKVTGQDNAVLAADRIIIATGSEPREIPAFPFDYSQIHDSTSILALKKLPKSLVIIGAGVIGCEFASLFNTLGVEITLVELLPRIIPMEAKELSDVLAQDFNKRGIKINTEVKVESIDKNEKSVRVLTSKGNFEAEMVLISVGRKLNTDKIGLDKAGIPVNGNGSISVDEHMETAIKGIYAIGDITAKWQLAHVASHQGIVAAENASGIDSIMHYDAVPSVIYTHPEIASVGLTLDEAIKKGFKAKSAAFPFQALGKSKATSHPEGFSQIIYDEKTGQILGAQVVGFEASSLITEMSIAITNELTLESITETIHAHPTISEGWLEAAYLAKGLPIHLPPKVGKRK